MKLVAAVIEVSGKLWCENSLCSWSQLSLTHQVGCQTPICSWSQLSFKYQVSFGTLLCSWSQHQVSCQTPFTASCSCHGSIRSAGGQALQLSLKCKCFMRCHKSITANFQDLAQKAAFIIIKKKTISLWWLRKSTDSHVDKRHEDITRTSHMT